MHYSIFLTAYHYSLCVFFPAKDTKAGAIEGCQTWMSLTLSDSECMSIVDIYVSLKPEAIKILKRCVFLIVIFLLGLFTWISTRSCGMKKQSVQYTSHFSIHSMQAMAICSRNGSSCLNCVISRWHCDCSTRMRCVDTFCWYLSLIYLYREDAWNVPVS